MIASLLGKLEAIYTSFVVVNVNGIGYQVFVPTRTLAELGSVGAEVKLYTHLHVREDNLSLSGFATPEELRLFETLLTDSGIGPKLALALLSALDAEPVMMAIASGDTELLRGVPGIGKKTAERIVLELKDKIGTELLAVPLSQSAAGTSEVVSALVSLGYSVSEATRAAASVPASADLSLQEKIKLALQYFGGR